MYSWLFRIMPGPRWLKAIELFLVLVAIVIALFQWGFPWAVETFNLSDNTVS